MEIDKKTQTINTYNTTASAMAKKFDNIGARVDDIEKGFSFLQKNNPKVLEIGCGNGRDAKEILKHTNNYLGVDISKEMIKLAREYVPKGHFEVADIENYKFSNNIDLIFSFASLLHSSKEDIKNILNRAYLSLEDSGIFYISLKYAKYHKEDKTDEFGTRTYYFYTPEDIKKLSGDQYKVLYEGIQNLRGQKWFTIILQK